VPGPREKRLLVWATEGLSLLTGTPAATAVTDELETAMEGLDTPVLTGADCIECGAVPKEGSKVDFDGLGNGGSTLGTTADVDEEDLPVESGTVADLELEIDGSRYSVVPLGTAFDVEELTAAVERSMVVALELAGDCEVGKGGVSVGVDATAELKNPLEMSIAVSVVRTRDFELVDVV
jgi:hypothetical protein